MCPHAAGTFLVCRPNWAAAGFLKPPAASLFLLSLTLRLALGFLFANRLSASSLPFLRLLARNFLPRSFPGSHIDLHVGLSLASIYKLYHCL